jgi:hypothetical protein
LLFGFEKEDLREQLDRIESKLDLGFEGLESQIANCVMAIMGALASESKEGPRLFTIEPLDGNWRRLTTKPYRLRLWCEAEGCQHPVLEEGKGLYEFEATRDWVKRIAPWANRAARLLRIAAAVAGPAANLFFGRHTVEESKMKDYLDIMKEGTKELLKGELEIHEPMRQREGLLTEPERSGVLALHRFLREHDPNHERLGLKRIPTYTGDYLWLCEKHHVQAQPKIPEKIEFGSAR